LRTKAWGARGRDRLGKTRRRPHLVLILGVDNDGQHKGRYSQREHEVLKPARRVTPARAPGASLAAREHPALTASAA
jgi:hypothetical protein